MDGAVDYSCQGSELFSFEQELPANNDGGRVPLRVMNNERSACQCVCANEMILPAKMSDSESPLPCT